MSVFRKIILIFLVVVLFGCEIKRPESIRYGIDICNFCKMTIVDPKWGAEIITDKGKVLKFDVVECMISYYYTSIDTNKVHSMYTIDFTSPGNFIYAKQAKYIRTHQFPSPMGLNVISLKSFEDTVKLGLKNEYETLDWWKVIRKVKDEILQ